MARLSKPVKSTSSSQKGPEKNARVFEEIRGCTFRGFFVSTRTGPGQRRCDGSKRDRERWPTPSMMWVLNWRFDTVAFDVCPRQMFKAMAVVSEDGWRVACLV
ncbi:hypothetical protein ACJ73_06281 [Blastomyces percursus]|uniref:Uncharacterized protein n=1 Tax=Blastomyces percursus TaxID=1658174 RepID=A0A1J9Q1C7_9EURO|nr:hypothetical protein ACJ73_06281 [Blastomyces percursus]